MTSQAKQERLETYYKMWLQGATQDEIREALGMNEASFDSQTHTFFNFCRKQLSKDTTIALANHERPDHLQLTDERREQFLELVASGLEYPRAAKLMGIPLITVTDVWFKSDPALRQEAEYAAELADAQVIIALKKRALGYMEKVKSRTKAEGEKVLENGRVIPYIVSNSVTETELSVRPDVQAQKLWLINRQPDKWSPDGERNRGNSKGKILEALDDEIHDGLDEEQDKAFDKESDEVRRG